MLIFTRRPGEEAVLTLTEPLPAGTQIVVATLGVIGNQTRQGFTAPKSVTIHRREIQDKVDAEKRGARNGDASAEPNGNV